MEHNTTKQDNNSAMSDFEKIVLAKINSGQIKMKPKYYFVLKVVLMCIVAFLVLTTSAVLVSFMLFSLRVSGRLFLLGFGGRGLVVFFITFPWFILLADVLFILLFERLVNHFKLGYRSPLLYTLGASAVIVIVGGFALDHISLHERLLHQMQSHRLGAIGGFVYTGVKTPPRQDGVFRGVIATSSGPITNTSFYMTQNDVVMSSSSQATGTMFWHVTLPAGSLFLTRTILPGDSVIVAGDAGSGTIEAYGVTKIEPGEDQ